MKVVRFNSFKGLYLHNIVEAPSLIHCLAYDGDNFKRAFALGDQNILDFCNKFGEHSGRLCKPIKDIINEFDLEKVILNTKVFGRLAEVLAQ